MMDSNLQRLQELQVLDSRVAGLERKLEAIPTRIQPSATALQQAKASVDAHPGRSSTAPARTCGRRKRTSSTRRPAEEARGQALRGQDEQGVLRRPGRDREREGREGPHRGGDPRRSWSSRSGSGARWSRARRGSARRRRRRRSRRPPPPRSCAPSRWTSRPRGASGRASPATCRGTCWSQYARLLKGRAGLAVALVGSNGICSGCRVTLTPQRFNEVRQSSQILVCENCGRFLYYQP